MPYETATLTVVEAAEARRSIRAFTDAPVPESDLREILRVTGLAPSAFNVQPWRFVVVTEPELKAKLGAAAFGQKQVAGAPAVIVLYSDMAEALERAEETVHPGMAARRDEVSRNLRGTWATRTDAERESWGAGQSYIALGYLLLAAQSLGYATSPMLGFDAAKVKEALGLPAHVAIPAIVAMGVAAEDGFAHHRHPVDRVATFR